MANLTLNAKSFRTTSVFNVNSGEKQSPAKSAKITMESAMIATFNVSAEQLEMKADIFRVNHTATLKFKTGSAALTTVQDISRINFDITNPGGQTVINGESVPSPYFRTSADNTTDHLVIESESGSITVTKADVDV